MSKKEYGRWLFELGDQGIPLPKLKLFVEQTERDAEEAGLHPMDVFFNMEKDTLSGEPDDYRHIIRVYWRAVKEESE